MAKQTDPSKPQSFGLSMETTEMINKELTRGHQGIANKARRPRNSSGFTSLITMVFLILSLLRLLLVGLAKLAIQHGRTRSEIESWLKQWADLGATTMTINRQSPSNQTPRGRSGSTCACPKPSPDMNPSRIHSSVMEFLKEVVSNWLTPRYLLGGIQ